MHSIVSGGREKSMGEMRRAGEGLVRFGAVCALPWCEALAEAVGYAALW